MEQEKNMETTKKPIQSTTIQGGIIVLLMAFLQIAGIDLDEGVITELIIGMFSMYGAIQAIYGRLRAKTIIE